MSTPITLTEAARTFRKSPTPWMIATMLVAATAARITLGNWQITDALVPLVMIAVFPFVEWTIHVFILHWKPRKVAGITIDSRLARSHREHHASPRTVPLIFIPWQTLLIVIPVLAAISLLAFPRIELTLTFLTCISVIGLIYEWTHFLIHSDYKPKTALYKAVWRNHRNHHFKNEHYWFTVTTAGTADRVLGTSPDPKSVETSPTAKNLHGAKSDM
ncbi:sterol desaturase family protein [Rhodococcus sp. IEGM 1379]|uniref:sterol desaturase family protein n=1 Tax=Rhodococcus sp. IEGM 1379 TaxID=3047086 RepID=UPI0024B7D5B4|nr:sterol desaturase family protein [Rhodococcus sp. IEGM 1379]MDI9917800.1 sterol desaturase family protein [Rhodococcus sp. IEGM 1379]